MTITTPIRRPLGTMIVYGYPKAELTGELAIAHRIGASLLEILPDWRSEPDPLELVARVEDAGLAIHSAHGCWGGQSIRARQVDLGSLETTTRLESIEDIKRCVDWLWSARGTFLVVHPGGLSDSTEHSDRRGALVESLRTLSPIAKAAKVVVCVENMPPGVYPGSKMTDLASIVEEVDSPSVALAMDTGHASIASSDDPSLETMTRAAGRLLATTHVHDNNGRQDLHWPPGLGGIDWDGWVKHLDEIDYRGPIMLECIRHLRSNSGCIDKELVERLGKMTGLERS